MSKRYELSDSEWERIAPLFPELTMGRPAK